MHDRVTKGCSAQYDCSTHHFISDPGHYNTKPSLDLQKYANFQRTTDELLVDHGLATISIALYMLLLDKLNTIYQVRVEAYVKIYRFVNVTAIEIDKSYQYKLSESTQYATQ